MTLPTHLLAGLIIGKITGDYPAAIAGSILIDVDHSITYFRHGILFKPRKLLHTIFNENDPWGDQRNILHSFFGFFILLALLLLINVNFALIFALAHFFHLIFDAIDSATFSPFFPLKKIAIRGFIKYSSLQEVFFAICLLLLLALIFLKT